VKEIWRIHHLEDWASGILYYYEGMRHDDDEEEEEEMYG